MKQITKVSLLIVGVLVATACGSTEEAIPSTPDQASTSVTATAVWGEYASVTEMVPEAHLIALGSVVGENETFKFTFPDGEPTLEYWSYRFSIDRVLVGDESLTGIVLDVAVLRNFEGSTPWEKGERLVAFLVKDPEGWMPLQGDLGVVAIQPTGILTPRSTNAPSDLGTTLDQLEAKLSAVGVQSGG